MTDEKTIAVFENACNEAEEIFVDRNQRYGNAIVETGVQGACIELVGCVARLKQLVLKDPAHGADANYAILRNILIDAHNYAVIAMMMQDQNNFTGVDNE
jgi:hypothetical protein